MAVKAITEDQMVHIVRNALLVAGQEMGSDGDHWPVINSTIHSIVKDWEDLKVERNVFAEVKKHYEDMIQQLVDVRNGSSDEEKYELDNTIVELRALYRACFDEVQNEYINLDDEEMPDHIKRTKVIIDTLEE